MGSSREATRVTPKEITEILRSPGLKIVYRQTCNWVTKVWYTPKRLQDDSSWKTITNKKIIHDYGIEMVIWKMWNRIDKLQTDGKMRWNSQMYKVLYVGDYGLYYLVCRRAFHSIHGVF